MTDLGPRRDLASGLLGAVPFPMEQRMAAVAGRLEAVEAIEVLQRILVTENPLGAKQQELVHFGQLVVLGERDFATRRSPRPAGREPRRPSCWEWSRRRL